MTDAVEHVFSQLKQMKRCHSRSEFSRKWLGREISYYRTVQSKGQTPSIQAHAHLVAQLGALGMYFSRCEFPTLIQVGNAYLELYAECLEALLSRALTEAR